MISCAPLLSANKLRVWIKTELVEILSNVFQKLEALALLTTSIYYTIVMEFYYSPIVDECLVNELINVWEKVIHNEVYILIQNFLFT